MYKIAMIGERDSVQGFMAIGFSIAEANNTEEAKRALHRLASDGEYAVIFIVEHYAAELEEEIARYKDQPLPAIAVIPGSTGSTGYGISSIRSAVERAIGADILFKD